MVPVPGLTEGLASLGISADTALVDKASHFLSLLLKWNKVTNLTAVTSPEKALYYHLLDSFSVCDHLRGTSIIDVGSGGGLPGIPLALVHPDKNFILLDSNGKKTRFITQVKIELDLQNVNVVQSRVENYTGAFDHVITRAFRSLPDLIDACAHLTGPDGTLLAMKGPGYEQEIEDIRDRGYASTVHLMQVPGVEAERFLVELSRDQT